MMHILAVLVASVKTRFIWNELDWLMYIRMKHTEGCADRYFILSRSNPSKCCYIFVIVRPQLAYFRV